MTHLTLECSLQGSQRVFLPQQCLITHLFTSGISVLWSLAHVCAENMGVSYMSVFHCWWNPAVQKQTYLHEVKCYDNWWRTDKSYIPPPCKTDIVLKVLVGCHSLSECFKSSWEVCIPQLCLHFQLQCLRSSHFSLSKIKAKKKEKPRKI